MKAVKLYKKPSLAWDIYKTFASDNSEQKAIELTEEILEKLKKQMDKIINGEYRLSRDIDDYLGILK